MVESGTSPGVMASMPTRLSSASFRWPQAADAARTMRAWAEATDHPLIRDLADAAELDALAYIQGADSDAVVELGLRLADLAGRLEPLEDVGASEEHRLLRSSLRDFADREIVPHAQTIHRKDRDLPESIVAGLA